MDVCTYLYNIMEPQIVVVRGAGSRSSIQHSAQVCTTNHILSHTQTVDNSTTETNTQHTHMHAQCVYIMCEYECVYMYMRVHVWQSCEKWADTGKRLAHYSPNLQSKLTQPLCFVG